MPPRHPQIAAALGAVRGPLEAALAVRRGGLLVACSGGPDSVALLGLVALLRRALGVPIAVGHVDHGLRAASAEDAGLVARLAGQLELPCRVAPLGLTLGPGLADRARRARYAALRAQAQALGAAWIVVGHSATDQAETVLMHLARGAGLDGLAAMRPWEGDLVRPLLPFARDELRQLAQRLGLEFRDDPTNRDLAQPRVALRHRVLPELRRINPRLEAAVYRATGQLAAADEALERWARAARSELGQRTDPATGGLRWDLGAWHALPPAVGTRLVRQLCLEAGAHREELGAPVLEAIDRAARAWGTGGPGGGHASRPGGSPGASPDPREPGPAAAPRRPRRWFLRPGLLVVVDRRGLSIGADRAANH